MILHLLDRVAQQTVRHRKVRSVRRRYLATVGLAYPEMLEGRALLAGVVLPNLPTGSRYQLAFVTAGIRPAASADINNYNTYVTSEASVSKSLPATTWRAWVSTATTNAQANAPTHDNVPIYNTRGELIAANKSEFLFPTHRATIAYDQFGIRGDRDVWTGSDYQGRGIAGQTVGSGGVVFASDIRDRPSRPYRTPWQPSGEPDLDDTIIQWWCGDHGLCRAVQGRHCTNLEHLP